MKKPFVLGRENFAAITSVEGLQLTSQATQRFDQMSSRTFAERREETVRAYKSDLSR